MKKTFILFLLSIGILSNGVVNKSFATGRSTIADKKVLTKKAMQKLLDNMIKNGSSEFVIPEGYTDIDSFIDPQGSDKVMSIVFPKTVVKSDLYFTYGFKNIIAITMYDTTSLSPGNKHLCNNDNLEFINVKSDTQITEKKILIERMKLSTGYAQFQYFENGRQVPQQTLKKLTIGKHDAEKMLDNAELEDKVVNIPEGIENIFTNSGFKYFDRFQFSITIPNSVKSIRYRNLYSDNIKAIIVRSDATKKLVEDSHISQKTKVFVVSDGIIDAAKIEQLLAYDTPVASHDVSNQTSLDSESSEDTLSSIDDNSELQHLKNV